MKTSELTGAALDWAVAQSQSFVEQGPYGMPRLVDGGVQLHYCGVYLGSPYAPSTDWAEGGPIIEREGINLTRFNEGEVDPEEVGTWDACYDRETFGGEGSFNGPTPLIAAMRCYVASKLGDDVDLPCEFM